MMFAAVEVEGRIKDGGMGQERAREKICAVFCREVRTERRVWRWRRECWVGSSSSFVFSFSFSSAAVAGGGGGGGDGLAFGLVERDGFGAVAVAVEGDGDF